MANEVLTILKFRRYSGETIDSVEKIMNSIEAHDGVKRFGDLLREDEFVATPEVDKGDWNLDHVGSKWCYIESMLLHDEPPTVRLISAWGPPLTGIKNMLRQVRATDKDLIQAAYIDEYYEFLGSVFYLGHEETGRLHKEWSDFPNLVANQNPGLADRLRDCQSFEDEDDEHEVLAACFEEIDGLRDKILDQFDKKFVG